MPEKCPLVGMTWSVDIPEKCFESCESLWEEAITEVKINGDYDVFPNSSNCSTHDFAFLEGEDMSIQPESPRSSKRIVGILDMCIDCGEEYGSQSYEFNCPID